MNPNPGIPPTEGITDETENKNSENADNPISIIPRKGGSGLNISNLNGNMIVQ